MKDDPTLRVEPLSDPSPAVLVNEELVDALKDAERWLDWCVHEHYAPDNSQEKAALAKVRKALSRAKPSP